MKSLISNNWPLGKYFVDHSGPSSVNGDDDSQQQEVVRGRVKTEEKPGTYNQLWTVEEQKRYNYMYYLKKKGNAYTG